MRAQVWRTDRKDVKNISGHCAVFENSVADLLEGVGDGAGGCEGKVEMLIGWGKAGGRREDGVREGEEKESGNVD